MTRNNSDRLQAGAKTKDTEAPPEALSPLEFAIPTEFVELMSHGRFYPEGHPLHGKHDVEIKEMTAKEEDILTSRALIQKGIALDKLIDSILIDKSITSDDLLVCDKMGLLVAARMSAYGEDYDAQVTCRSCGNKVDVSFDLNKYLELQSEEEYDAALEELGVEITEKNTFYIVLPKTQWKVELQPLFGYHEKKMVESSEKRRKAKMPESMIVEQFRHAIVSVSGHAEIRTIMQAIENMPASDTRYLRKIYSQVLPNVNMKYNMECDRCFAESEVDVPITAEFFWPR
jgi:hypothetical protein